jgi:hypothetical protein
VRLTTRQPAAEVPDTLAEHVGRVIPLRIGDLAYTAVLEAVVRDGGDVVATFEVPDSDFRWEVLTPAP